MTLDEIETLFRTARSEITVFVTGGWHGIPEHVAVVVAGFSDDERDYVEIDVGEPYMRQHISVSHFMRNGTHPLYDDSEGM
jgi:hypothetical protein